MSAAESLLLRALTATYTTLAAQVRKIQVQRQAAARKQYPDTRSRPAVARQASVKASPAPPPALPASDRFDLYASQYATSSPHTP